MLSERIVNTVQKDSHTTNYIATLKKNYMESQIEVESIKTAINLLHFI